MLLQMKSWQKTLKIGGPLSLPTSSPPHHRSLLQLLQPSHRRITHAPPPLHPCPTLPGALLLRFLRRFSSRRSNLRRLVFSGDTDFSTSDPEKSKFREGLESVLRSRYTGRKAYVKRHFVKMGGYEDLERVRANRPVDLSQENWDKTIRLFTSEKHMRLSAQNKINKAKQVVVYRGGRCSYSNACHKLNKSRVEAFGDAHRTKDGTFHNPISEAQYNALVRELDLQSQLSSSSSTPTPVNEVNAFEKVLGARRGVIKGIGHKPSSSSTSAAPVQEQSSRRQQPSKFDIMLQNPEFKAAMEELVRKFTAENDDSSDNENGDENNDA